MTEPPIFGRRALLGAPAPQPPPPRPSSLPRFRSQYVLVTALGLMAIGAAADARRAYQCRERGPQDQDQRPADCSRSSGYSGGGHGFFGGSSYGGGYGHASFGGFGGHGFGHGGGE